MFLELVDEVRFVRKNLKAIQPVEGQGAQYELGTLRLAEYPSLFRVNYVVTVNGQPPTEDRAETRDKDRIAEILLSKVLDNTIFNPVQGVYRSLPVKKIELVRPWLLVDVETPQNWDGYERTKVASYALAVDDTDCEPITGLEFHDVTAVSSRAAKLSFKLTLTDTATVGKIQNRTNLKLALITHYRRPTPDLSNKEYSTPTGDNKSCLPD